MQHACESLFLRLAVLVDYLVQEKLAWFYRLPGVVVGVGAVVSESRFYDDALLCD